jgi:branched-chain amino acid transport system substrate-binding protein
MQTTMIRAALAVILLGGAPLTASAQAQGVSDREIVLGHTAGFTGPVAGSVRESTDGALLYFDWLNSRGGINGRKIVLRSLDDKFDPKQAGDNVKRILSETPPLALVLTRGTPHTEAALPLAQEAGIPIISPGTGADVFHSPVNPLIFNLRAKYQLEVEKAIDYLLSTGVSKIALVHVNDSFGKDGLAGFERRMAELKLKPVFITTFDRTTGDTTDAVQVVLKADAQATIVVGSAAHSADLIQKVRKAGNQTLFVTLSNNGTKSYIKLLGANGRGVIVTQVFPNPATSTLPVAREMRRLTKDKKDFILSQQAMEGFLAAKLVGEALQRAGKHPTRKGLMAALETLKDYDLGGFWVTYSPADHSGGKFVEMSIIDERGEFLQ